jgi:AhpD family alkylhydroperoxidase
LLRSAQRPLTAFPPISHHLVDQVYLRVSQINGCAYCIDKHSRDLLKGGFAVEKLLLVAAWRKAGSLFD